MTDRQPPPWDTDSLSKYFADAEYNERVTAINYPDIYDLLRRLQRAFEQAEETIEKGFSQGHFLVPRLLGLRTQSVFSPAARREDVGTWRDVHRRDGGLKTCWTKPLPGCSPMGMACRWGSASDAGVVQNGGETRHRRETKRWWAAATDTQTRQGSVESWRRR